MALSSYPGSYDPRYPFFNPNDPYGWTGQNPQYNPNDPYNVNYVYGEDNPEASFTRRLAELGYGGQAPQDVWARSLYSRARQGYEAAKMNNLDLKWQNYLETNFGPDKLEQMWLDQSPTQRGETRSLYAPRARWQQRPN